MAEGENLWGKPAQFVREAPVCVCVHAWNCVFMALLKAHEAAICAQPVSPVGLPSVGPWDVALVSTPSPGRTGLPYAALAWEGMTQKI